ncbi:MAG: chromate transporter, partial [Chloroflexota bacterium]
VTASVVGVIASLGVLFGTSVLLRGAPVDLYAVVVTILTFVVLRTVHTPVQYLVLAGALAGIVWRSIAPAL